MTIVDITRIDQVALVVTDLEAALEALERQYGLTPAYREVLDEPGIEEAMIDLAGVWLQVIAPTRDDSVVSDWLASHGPGLHHLGFGVGDLAGALAELPARGGRPRSLTPMQGGGGHLVAFVEPDPALGVLVELVQDG